MKCKIDYNELEIIAIPENKNELKELDDFWEREDSFNIGFRKCDDNTFIFEMRTGIYDGYDN